MVTMRASVDGSSEPDEPNQMSFVALEQTTVLVSVRPGLLCQY